MSKFVNKVYKVSANNRQPSEFQQFKTVGFLSSLSADQALEDAKDAFAGEFGLAVEMATELEIEEFWS